MNLFIETTCAWVFPTAVVAALAANLVRSSKDSANKCKGLLWLRYVPEAEPSVELVVLDCCLSKGLSTGLSKAMSKTSFCFVARFYSCARLRRTDRERGRWPPFM